MGAPIVDRNLARDDPTTPSRASRTSKRAASTWTNRRVHRPADAPSTGSRRLRRATAPSFHSEPPTLHPRLTRPPPIPRDGPAGVRGGRRAHHAHRSREAQPATHHASTRHGHQTRARVSVPRPRHHDSRHGDATDIRAAHRRLRPEEQVAGSNRAVVVQRARARRAPTTRGQPSPGSGGEGARGRGGCSLDVPRRTNTEHHSGGIVPRDGRERWGDSAEDAGRRFGGTRRRRTKKRSPSPRRDRASDPRRRASRIWIGLDGDGSVGRSFDIDTTSPHHNTVFPSGSSALTWCS